MPLEFLISALVTLLVVVDPVGLVPAFLAVTDGLPASPPPGRAARLPDRRRDPVRRGAGRRLAAAQLGITLPAFRIAGGLLLFAIAFEMVLGLRVERAARRPSRRSRSTSTTLRRSRWHSADGRARRHHRHRAAGRPGRRAAVGSRSCSASSSGGGRLPCDLPRAERIGKLLGVTGNVVLSRLLGVILAALAVQYVIDGVRAAFFCRLRLDSVRTEFRRPCRRACRRAGHRRLARRERPASRTSPRRRRRRAAAAGIEHGERRVEALQHHFGGVFLDAVLVGVFAGLQLALEIDFGALLQILLDDLAQPFIEDHHAVPLGLFLALAGRLVAPAFRGGDGKIGDRPPVLGAPDFRIAPRLPTRITLLTEPAMTSSPEPFFCAAMRARRSDPVSSYLAPQTQRRRNRARAGTPQTKRSYPQRTGRGRQYQTPQMCSLFVLIIRFPTKCKGHLVFHCNPQCEVGADAQG